MRHSHPSASCHGGATATTLETALERHIREHHEAEAAGPLPRVELIGHPNVGKSTLFNLLTGAHQATVNAPRTTVTFASGTWRADGARVNLIDLPGTDSLIPQSPDEEVTAQAAVGGGGGPLASRPDLAVVVLDATALASSLYLLGQAMLLGIPVVGALTLVDIATKHGTDLDPGALSQAVGVPIIAINPRLDAGTETLGRAVRKALDQAQAPDSGEVAARRTAGIVPGYAVPNTAEAALQGLTDHADGVFEWCTDVIGRAGVQIEQRVTGTDRVDRVLLKWWAGVPIFLVVLWLLFQLTTTVAGPLQDWCQDFITQTFAGWVTSFLGLFGWGTGWFNSLVVDGVLAGVGVVVSFLPLMIIMFAAISLLEDSGYMARVAVVADRLMRGIGLDGRAVLPLVIGFGCNLPGLAATKTLPNARQRLLTALLVPYSSCTARLVVYLFIANIFFPAQAGTVVFCMYLLSVVVIVLVGLILKRFGFRELGHAPMVLALPAYQLPRLWPLVRTVWLRCRDFVEKAGKIILALTLAIWLLMAIPVAGGYSFAQADIPAHDTLLGRVSDVVAPVFKPAGYGDWHMAAALITGFAAKEVVVGTIATTYELDEPDNAQDVKASPLGDQVHATLERTSGGHSAAAALAFMLFCLGYAPCLVTVAEERRLIGGRRTALAVTGSIVVAWCLSTLLFQVGRLL
ncbi:MAG: ferrous iron transport protein B [Bifidobacteriaceae bacterium]|jgi:ferrous iron transport protein B|nr:ferrous iron transport protein B [Bifidobacteriaceae bacterium]